MCWNRPSVRQRLGAQILDVNGAPGVDEPVLMEQGGQALQSGGQFARFCGWTSSSVEALARGLRVYNGKPIVNSTPTASRKSFAAILPLCKKYGAAIVDWPSMKKASSPKPADRVAIARRITEAARWQQASLGKISTS